VSVKFLLDTNVVSEPLRIASVHHLMLITANKTDLRAFKGLRIQSWA